MERNLERQSLECCGDQTKESRSLNSGSEVGGGAEIYCNGKKTGSSGSVIFLLHFMLGTQASLYPPYPKLGFSDPDQNMS